MGCYILSVMGSQGFGRGVRGARVRFWGIIDWESHHQSARGAHALRAGGARWGATTDARPHQRGVPGQPTDKPN
jgi:hypothetical protein